jgi:hypothetical protein
MQSYQPPKAMKQIGSLFDRYQKTFKAPQGSVEQAAVISIKTVTGFDLERHQVSYTVATKTLYIKAPSLLRSELRFYHARILEQLSLELGDQNAPKTIL